MDILNLKSIPIYETLFKEDENGRIINIYKLEYVCISGCNLYYPNVLLHSKNKLYLPINEKTMSLKRGTKYEIDGMKFNYNDNIIEDIENKPVFFFVYNIENYYHFVYDTLPYLISYLELKKRIPELRILTNYSNNKNKFYKFVEEFLELIGILEKDILIINTKTKYSNIYISSSYTHDDLSNKPPRKEIYEFYKSLIPKNKNNKTPKKIYISRRTWINNDTSNIGTNYTTRRKLVNEDILVEYLLTKGFQEIFTENLTTLEKIEIFSNAEVVVGAIGGGICNVLFSQKETKLYVIVSPTFLDVNYRFKYSLDIVDTKYIMNTENVDKGEFKKYMRVECKNRGIIGEIEEIYDNSLLISYTSGYNVGWNLEEYYKKMEINKIDVIRLDEGLNSPWILHDIYILK